MSYTVKQLANLAGVSTRTLHYYDEIGLLAASTYGENGYRYYDEQAVLRLQQILFFRELDFSLAEIQSIVDRPEFNLLQALQIHRRALQERAARLNSLIQTVDQTILYLKGKREMSKSELFEGFSEEQQQQYVEEARELWGESVTRSVQKWSAYSKDQQAQIQAEGGAIYSELVGYIGQDPALPEVQRLIGRWHQHLHAFYEPTPEILRGLGNGYADDPRFAAFFQRLHPQLPEFLRQAISRYCDGLEG